MGGSPSLLPRRSANRKETFEMVKDPVCNMSVDEKSPYKSTQAGKTAVFCSSACKTKFDKEPGKYASPAAAKTGKAGGCCA